MQKTIEKRRDAATKLKKSRNAPTKRVKTAEAYLMPKNEKSTTSGFQIPKIRADMMHF